MLTVSEQTKQAYLRDGVHKKLEIIFPSIGVFVYNDRIQSESFTLNESICDKQDIEFVGCIASSIECTLYNVDANLKGQEVIVNIKAGDNDPETIPLFHGIVDSVKMQTDHRFKKITAYDKLYSANQKDIAYWYNHLSLPMRLRDFRDSLFKTLGIEQEDVELPNDNVEVYRYLGEPETLECGPVLKSICQINGAFGIIGRNGKFKYVYIPKVYERAFPGGLYPPFYPSSEKSGATDPTYSLDNYKSIEYEEYSVKPVERIQIRMSNNDAGIIIGNNKGNKYIIQNNMFCNMLYDEENIVVANNIWPKISDISYHPCDIKNVGLPFIECGDVIEYRVRKPGGIGNYQVNFFTVMSRSLSGVQILTDNYKAEGDEEQKEFITDMNLSAQLNDYYTKDETDQAIEEAISEMEVKVVSCYTLPPPEQQEAGTIYLVQGDVQPILL